MRCAAASVSQLEVGIEGGGRDKMDEQLTTTTLQRSRTLSLKRAAEAA